MQAKDLLMCLQEQDHKKEQDLKNQQEDLKNQQDIELEQESEFEVTRFYNWWTTFHSSHKVGFGAEESLVLEARGKSSSGK